jgi:hypothetical protein
MNNHPIGAQTIFLPKGLQDEQGLAGRLLKDRPLSLASRAFQEPVPQDGPVEYKGRICLRNSLLNGY